jgi:hypothetical protein
VKRIGLCCAVCNGLALLLVAAYLLQPGNQAGHRIPTPIASLPHPDPAPVPSQQPKDSLSGDFLNSLPALQPQESAPAGGDFVDDLRRCLRTLQAQEAARERADEQKRTPGSSNDRSLLEQCLMGDTPTPLSRQTAGKQAGASR